MNAPEKNKAAEFPIQIWSLPESEATNRIGDRLLMQKLQRLRSAVTILRGSLNSLPIELKRVDIVPVIEHGDDEIDHAADFRMHFQMRKPIQLTLGEHSDRSVTPILKIMTTATGLGFEINGNDYGLKKYIETHNLQPDSGLSCVKGV